MFWGTKDIEHRAPSTQHTAQERETSDSRQYSLCSQRFHESSWSEAAGEESATRDRVGRGGGARLEAASRKEVVAAEGRCSELTSCSRSSSRSSGEPTHRQHTSRHNRHETETRTGRKERARGD